MSVILFVPLISYVLLGEIALFVIIPVVLLIIGGSMYWAHVAEKKRKESLSNLASELQLEFSPEGNPQLQSDLAHLKLFGQGRGRKLTNLVHGSTDEVQIALFDYRYTTGSGKNSHTHRQTVACLRSDLLAHIPQFLLRPEGMLDKIGSAMGFQDIDFDSHPMFSKLFVLQSNNEEAIRHYFNSPILEYFESQKGISVQSEGGQLVFFRQGRRLKPEQYKDLLGEAYQVFGVLIDSHGPKK